METRFTADAMLGKLSKWLRIMGYDAHHQMSYEQATIQRSIQEGRVFLSRRARISEEHPDAIWLRSDHVGEQLRELVGRDVLRPYRADWFRRCLVCNVPLRKAPGEISMESVPDYILHHKNSDIRWCPACRRLFWAGTHRENMIRQLEKWGL
jgi:uncharacterized protein with PIN domain